MATKIKASVGRPIESDQDDGCHLHPSCLVCPEPICIFECRGGQAELDAIKQRIRIRELLLEGKTAQQVADIMGIKERTVRRARARTD